MDKQDAKVLLDKYEAGLCTPQEKALVESWFLDITKDLAEPSANKETPELKAEIWQRIGEATGENNYRPRRLWPRITAAASVLLVLSVGSYFAFHKKADPAGWAQLKPGVFRNDAVAGNKAILTLANGKQLALSAIPTGHIGQTNIKKTANGALVYENTSASKEDYNTLMIPRGGGTHEIRLADGTLVLLDAGSSLRFPVAFNGKERRVSITGQAYFEVVHDPRKPFLVAAGSQTIKDIGTHFNVNTFDGMIKTTLLEGSVKVDETVLVPGEQSVQMTGKQLYVINQVDAEEVMAWKNNLFKFSKHTDLQTVMNQLSRWYDLDVSYQGKNKAYHFNGFISRNSKLSSVCKILSISGVQFAVYGKKIIVYQ